MSVCLFRLVAFVCFVLLAVPATAEEVTWPRMFSSRLELQTDRAALSEGEDLLSPLTMHGQLRLSEFLSAYVDGALLFSRTPPVFGLETKAWGLGNISAGVAYLKMLDSTAALSVGLSFATRARPQLNSSLDPLRMEAAVRRGGADVFLFLPNDRFVELPVEVELMLGPLASFRSRLTPVIWIPTTSVPTASTTLSFEHWDELSTVFVGGLRGGMHLQAVLFLGDDLTHKQTFLIRTAATPYLEFEPRSRGVSCRLGLMLPVTGDSVITKTGDRLMLQLQTGLVF